MELGNVATSDSIGLFFMPGDLQPDRIFNTHKSIDRQGGVVLDGPYSGGNYRLNSTSIPAHICRSCRKIVMAY
jgi:hypothetical protein